MNFRETLAEHLRAIRSRDLPALRATLPEEELLLITADGRLVRSAREFLRMHEEWFGSSTWSLDAEPIGVRETADLGVAVFRLDYRDVKPDGGRLHETSYLTLVFARQGGRWVMVQDQNTPVRPPSTAGQEEPAGG